MWPRQEECTFKSLFFIQIWKVQIRKKEINSCVTSQAAKTTHSTLSDFDYVCLLGVILFCSVGNFVLSFLGCEKQDKRSPRPDQEKRYYYGER